MGEGKEICVERGVEARWRWRTNDSNDGMGGVILIAVCLQNMSITQRPLWIDDVKCDEQR